MASFPMILNEPNPVSKVTFFDAEYLTNGYI